MVFAHAACLSAQLRSSHSSSKNTTATAGIKFRCLYIQSLCMRVIMELHNAILLCPPTLKDIPSRCQKAGKTGSRAEVSFLETHAERKLAGTSMHSGINRDCS
jgi:hypothetical protein